MCIVTSHLEQLKTKYNNVIDFKQICKENKIGVTTADLPDDINGHTIFTDTHATIALNRSLSMKERHDWAWHELWHALRRVPATPKEEARATLFAALIIAPNLQNGDTIATVAERYNTSYRFAKARIEFEIKQSAI
jgi:alcohol dehydrogenase YqhD (iron-dependent ADH family)